MHKTLHRVFSVAVVALGLTFANAFAQDEVESWVPGADGDRGVQLSGDANKIYVLETSGSWGDEQDAAVLLAGGTVLRKHGPSGLATVSSADPDFLTKALKSPKFMRVAQDFEVQWQEPLEPVSADDFEEEVVTPGNDTFVNLLWNMTAIDAFGAWAAGYDGAGVRVAVIDGGTCSAHADLAANIDVAASRSFRAGFNYDQDTGTAASFRHACHVAGIIAALDNNIGTVGVAPRATIIACKALHGGSGPFSAVIEAILYAATPLAEGGGGADIINMSLGATFAKGGGNTGAGALVASMNRAVNYASSRGVLVVCSSGNSFIDFDHSNSLTHVPSQSGSAIAVSATAPIGFAVGWPSGATNYRTPTTYTNYGRSVIWVSAPGGDDALPGNAICSIPRVVGAPVTTFCWVFDLVFAPGSQDGRYFWVGGTSMAAPHVSGVAALIKQRFPGISLGDLKAHIKNTADDEGANGTDPFHGHGFVNAYRAVTEPLSVTSPETETAFGGSEGVDLAVSRKLGSSAPQISFVQRRAGMVRVDLFDLAGRNVATLYNGHAPAGRTILAWSGRGSNGKDLARGSYYARVKSDGGQATRQVLLLAR